jgi:hypothetical protein
VSPADHVAQHFHRVVLADALVGDAAFGDQFAQAADAGGVHFQPEVVVLRIRGRDGVRGFPHAAADLEYLRCRTAEHDIQIERRGAYGMPIFGIMSS